ncbi:MAG: alpha/beta fold hydrolase [Sandaracinus sp.]
MRALLRHARETALGHVATVGGYARAVVRPEVHPQSEEWTAEIEDAHFGAIPLRGALSQPGTSTAFVIVHGMGGNLTSPYTTRMARAVARAGHTALRLLLRGASGDGVDLYHAGQGDDLAQVTRSPALAGYDHLVIVGYSLGGHISLRHAADGPHDPRLRAVVAVCPPIDLEHGTRAVQRFDRRPYQEFVLRSLRRQLAEVSARRGAPLPRVDPAAIRTIRDWDRLVICPRFGFESLEAFYRDEAAGPRLGEIRVPTLLVVAERDPMIAIDTVVPWLDHASDAVTIVRKRRGGHVAFPRDVGLLDESGGTIEEEIVRWVSPHLVSAVR